MSNYIFPTVEEFWKRRGILEIIRKRGAKAAITDFSILLGGWVERDDSYYTHIDNDDSLAGRTGYYWTRSSDDGESGMSVIGYNGVDSWSNIFDRNVGARPALPFSSIDKIPTNGVNGKDTDGVKYVEYGFYPQSVATKTLQLELEQQFNKGKLNSTGNRYTTDSRKYDEYKKKHRYQGHEEYEYKGKRYIRVKANLSIKGEKIKLSNEETYRSGDIVWVNVEPIKWLISERENLMITEKIIFAGIQFKSEKGYDTNDFENTDIYEFTNNIWSKDIEQVRNKRKKHRK